MEAIYCMHHIKHGSELACAHVAHMIYASDNMANQCGLYDVPDKKHVYVQEDMVC